MDRQPQAEGLHQNSLRKIGITLGDPAGIGPEVVRKALATGKLAADFHYEIIGNPPDCIPGQPTRKTAQAAFASLELAAQMALRDEIAAVVTGPIHKFRMREIGFEFAGQTEFFAARCGVPDFAMLLTGGKITVALVTAHVPLREVWKWISAPEIWRIGNLLVEFLFSRGIKHPRIAVAGFNPHAGESGMLGSEEMEIIQPATESLQKHWANRVQFSGPISPDTVFHRAVNGEFDAVLCMYHDQGLIPLKLHAFDAGVNVTLGLPIIRTSPDHGTAFEIAGKELANPSSMIAALHLAAELARHRLSSK